jgi:hypothetical protein
MTLISRTGRLQTRSYPSKSRKHNKFYRKRSVTRIIPSRLDIALTLERKELLATWRHIVGKGILACGFKCPTSGDQIRRRHNQLGWRATRKMVEGGRVSLGNCSGAIYRTLRFINIPPACRNGTLANHANNSPTDVCRNIHIEHTIPVAALAQHINNTPIRQECYKTISPEVFWFLSNSVVTAFHRSEKTVIKTGFHSRTEAFAECKGNYKFPFHRYKSDDGFKIYDILNRKIVDFKIFTMDHHRQNIKDLLDEVLDPDSCGSIPMRPIAHSD